jgi:hypothetical protein
MDRFAVWHASARALAFGAITGLIRPAVGGRVPLRTAAEGDFDCL